MARRRASAAAASRPSRSASCAAETFAARKRAARRALRGLMKMACAAVDRTLVTRVAASVARRLRPTKMGITTLYPARWALSFTDMPLRPRLTATVAEDPEPLETTRSVEADMDRPEDKDSVDDTFVRVRGECAQTHRAVAPTSSDAARSSQPHPTHRFARDATTLARTRRQVARPALRASRRAAVAPGLRSRGRRRGGLSAAGAYAASAADVGATASRGRKDMWEE